MNDEDEVIGTGRLANAAVLSTKKVREYCRFRFFVNQTARETRFARLYFGFWGYFYLSLVLV
jgi:hypothetical protein